MSGDRCDALPNLAVSQNLCPAWRATSGLSALAPGYPAGGPEVSKERTMRMSLMGSEQGYVIWFAGGELLSRYGVLLGLGLLEELACAPFSNMT